MKYFIGMTMAASALVVNVNAQSANDGFKLISYKKYESAINAMKTLADKDPQASLALGLAHLEMDQLDEAKAAFAKHPSDWTAKIGQAYIYMADNNIAQAEALLNSVVDGAKKKEWEKYKFAADVITNTGKGSADKAIEWYEKALTIKPDASTHIGFGNLYLFKFNNGGEAYVQYNAAVKIGDAVAKSQAYSQLGSIGLRSRDAELAITNFDLSKATDPNNPLPYIQLAKQYDKVGKSALALENIEKFYQLSDKRYIDKIDYVNVLIGAKQFEKAEGILNDLLKSNSDKPALYRALAYSQYENKNYKEALNSITTYFNKSTDKTKLSLEDFNYAGKIYAMLAKEDESQKAEYLGKADENFARAIALDTNASKRETYLEIGNIFKALNNFEGASKYYKMIIAENPKASAFDYYNAGLYTFYSEKPEEALKIFTQMAEIHPDEPVAVYWQARSASATDVKAETGAAVPYYTKWLAIEKEGYNPDPKEKMRGYSYIMWFNMNKKSYKAAAEAADALLALDPTNEDAKKIKDYVSKI
jgi:tetratricopeptide (TPR) repeat protein